MAVPRVPSSVRGWLLLGLLATVPSSALADRVPVPTLTKGQGEQCVEPTDVMRRDHMKFLMHHRDDTMREGIRTKQHSLKECIECHVPPRTAERVVRSDSPEHFCNACHAYAAVSMDCFQCHSDQPSGKGHHFHSLSPQGSLQDRARGAPLSRQELEILASQGK